mmetsp:Transcript_13926/g.16603  ORF Transcript_13926/g.16603 Transcript_13926/m.16603 type:complete len:239 (-) Transcript_13926:558-1274(-)
MPLPSTGCFSPEFSSLVSFGVEVLKAEWKLSLTRLHFDWGLGLASSFLESAVGGVHSLKWQAFNWKVRPLSSLITYRLVLESNLLACPTQPLMSFLLVPLTNTRLPRKGVSHLLLRAVTDNGVSGLLLSPDCLGGVAGGTSPSSSILFPLSVSSFIPPPSVLTTPSLLACDDNEEADVDFGMVGVVTKLLERDRLKMGVSVEIRALNLAAAAAFLFGFFGSANSDPSPLTESSSRVSF